MMIGKIIKIYEKKSDGIPGSMKLRLEDQKTFNNTEVITVYKLPDDIKKGDIIGFDLYISEKTRKLYGVYKEKAQADASEFGDNVARKKDDEKKKDAYFEKYGDNSEKQEAALKIWIASVPGLEEKIKKYEQRTKEGQDYIVTFIGGTSTSVEVKIEEPKWFIKNDNITLDAISAFNYIDENVKREVSVNNKNWVPIDYYGDFKKGVEINKWGTLYESDAKVMAKVIVDEDGNNLFVKGFDLQKLKANAEYFEKNYKLRINDKGRYDISEAWESASYCVKKYDEKLNECEIKSVDDIPKIDN